MGKAFTETYKLLVLFVRCVDRKQVGRVARQWDELVTYYVKRW